MKTFTMSISDMNNGAEEEKINDILHDVWGVRKVQLNAENSKAVVSYDEKAASLQDFTQAIVDSGYEINIDEELT